jgi:hypothetical protein
VRYRDLCRFWFSFAVIAGILPVAVQALALADEVAPTAPTGVMWVGGDQGATDSPVLKYASELAGDRTIRAVIRNDETDAYRFSVTGDKTIKVETGSERGVLYAVFDVLDGRTSGDETPAFSIRGLNPVEAIQRHTPAMMQKLIDRMGHWRMNYLVAHMQYGFLDHKDLTSLKWQIAWQAAYPPAVLGSSHAEFGSTEIIFLLFSSLSNSETYPAGRFENG